MRRYPVHHVIPLEYVHLFPELEINARVNLVGVAMPVHTRINNVWTSVRRVSESITAEQVKDVAAIVNKHFGRWYDVVSESSISASALDQAERAALRDVVALLGL